MVNNHHFKNGDNMTVIEVIGTKNCTACLITKKLLAEREIAFEYKLYDELTPADKEAIMAKARAASHMNFPIIMREGAVVQLSEVQ